MEAVFFFSLFFCFFFVFFFRGGGGFLGLGWLRGGVLGGGVGGGFCGLSSIRALHFLGASIRLNRRFPTRATPSSPMWLPRFFFFLIRVTPRHDCLESVFCGPPSRIYFAGRPGDVRKTSWPCDAFFLTLFPKVLPNRCFLQRLRPSAISNPFSIASLDLTF